MMTKPKTRGLTFSKMMCALVMLIGAQACAPDDEPTVADESPETRVAQPTIEEEEDDLHDKGLRKDYCCVYKTAGVVNNCVDYHRTKVGAWSACYTRSADSDMILRDGKCSRYPTCSGF